MDLHRIIQQRGGCKAQLSRAHTSAEEFVRMCDSLDTLKEKLNRLRATFDHFIELTEELAIFEGEADYVNPYDDWGTYEDKYYTTHALYSTALRELENRSYRQSVAVAEEGNSMRESSKELHLGKIRIPPFSGNYEDWNQFSDLFLGSIDKKTSLTKCQKFHYLKSYLEGEALSLVKHIAVTDTNYQDAWERLEQRYNKRKLIARSFINNYLSLPSLSTVSVMDLRKLADGADASIRGLNALLCNGRDPWLIHIMLSKLDTETRQAWAESHISNEGNVTIEDLLTFIFKRCDALESCQTSRISPSKRRAASYHSNIHKTLETNCSLCQKPHPISTCAQFKAMGIDIRRSFANDNKLCFNCLSRSHSVKDCSSKHNCRICNSRHHTLVHREKPSPPVRMTSNTDASSLSLSDRNADSDPAATSHHTLASSSAAQTQTLLPTILATVVDAWGNRTACRMLLDTGSTITMATEAFVQRIGAKRTHARISVVGLADNNAGVTRGRVTLQLLSRTTTASLDVAAFIMSTLTSSIPAQSINTGSSYWQKICQLPLADPTFDQPGNIDILIGSDQIWNFYTGKRKQFGMNVPIALFTTFGWVITGTFHGCNDERTYAQAHFAHDDLDALARTFMELESVQPSKATIDATDVAEQHFAVTHTRTKDGVYIVKYPFKTDAAPIGEALTQARKRFAAMERKFRSSPGLKLQYTEFMDDYLNRGHMELLKTEQVHNCSTNLMYLAHHAVFKLDSSTTKCRVVFDGSVKDSTGYSLNDRLHVGPPIQRDLFGVCMRFRQHRYVFCADIEKMFRGILVAEEHTNFQRILWRKEESAPLEHYRLLTVTYGLASSPFLAVRVLEQLASDYQSIFPSAARVLSRDAYVDDIATGCDTIDEILALKDELILLLEKAKFRLRKWSSNCWPLLNAIPREFCDYKQEFLTDSTPLHCVKILGLHWNPGTDTIAVKRSGHEITRLPTKRQLLSELSKIYDPIGLLAPMTIYLKILFQDSWLSETKWDEQLPRQLCTRWHQFIDEAHNIDDLSVPRHIGYPFHPIELHGFADASAQAYAAVVYSRVHIKDRHVVTLLAARTRVAPIKPISIPRLELNAAHLLIKLITIIKQALTIPISSVSCWTDSEIVLHWLSAPPRTWNTYVCNRTAEILEVCPRSNWQHISTCENPADCASRGMVLSKLKEHQLWWTGPSWLSQERGTWPPPKAKFAQLAESLASTESKLKPAIGLLISHEINVLTNLINKISSWTRLLRITAYCYRFVQHLRYKTSFAPFLTAMELQQAQAQLLKHVQMGFFNKEYTQVLNGETISAKSRLLRYTPFIDVDGLMRVGGRIQQSTVAYNAKHPILIPKESPVAVLLVRYQHIKTLHAGADYTFHSLKEQYWILGARNIVRKVVFGCKKCFLQRRQTSSQLMAELPIPRVQPTRCFLHTGMDYAGPVSIKISLGRTPKFGKAWFAVFVCMSTKAVHIELVSDLSTSAFIAAFKRFWSRRGPISDLYSDNGTNFQGAKRELSEMQQLAITQSKNEEAASFMAGYGISWHFIPPSAPHFGGLWESCVRSIKQHLRRVIGCSVLTFEDYSTVLTQIEAILNSRPLCAPSDNSLDPLTPAHFLIGQSHMSIAEPSLLDINVNRLHRWKQLQSMVQGFWKRWSAEYITSLQARYKWNHETTNITSGTLVVLKEPNLPPSKWLLGRIEETHAGTDGRVRVVTIKTANGTYKRPVTKIAVLPLS